MIAGMNGYNSPYESTSNMYMFAIANSYHGAGKIYYLQINDGGTLVRDFIPVLSPDGEPCMFDRVTGKLFCNQGSGKFLFANNCGQNNPCLLYDGQSQTCQNKCSNASFLKSTAAADGINTGIYYDWSQDFEMDIEFSVSTLGKRYIIFGDYSGTGINLEVYSNDKVRIWGHSGTPTQMTSHTVLADEKVRVRWVRDVSDSSVTVTISGDGWSETISKTNMTHSDTSSIPEHFFKDQRSMNAGVSIYKCDIKMGNQEYSFKPTLDPWNQPSFREQEERKFYYNENTGTGGFLTN